MAVPETTLNEIFSLLRDNTAAIAEVDKKVSVLIDARATKDKAFDDLVKETKTIDVEVQQLKLWRASQAGVAGLVKDYGPILVSCAALYYAAKAGG